MQPRLTHDCERVLLARLTTHHHYSETIADSSYSGSTLVQSLHAHPDSCVLDISQRPLAQLWPPRILKQQGAFCRFRCERLRIHWRHGVQIAAPRHTELTAEYRNKTPAVHFLRTGTMTMTVSSVDKSLHEPRTQHDPSPSPSFGNC